MGQTRTSALGAARPLPPSADIGPGGQSVGQAAQFCLAPSPPASQQLFDDDQHEVARSGEAAAQPVQTPEQSGHHSDDNQEPSQIVPENRDHDQEREGLPRLEA